MLDEATAAVLQVNIVGPANLTMRLLPLLLRAPAPRIVNVASIMHRHAEVPSTPDEFLRCGETEGPVNCTRLYLCVSKM